MSWGNVQHIDEDNFYKASFGDLPNEAVVDDGMNRVGIQTVDGQLVLKSDTFTKAVNVGAASGEPGFGFAPIVYDQDVVDITRKVTPLITLLPKVTNKSLSAHYYRITARGGGEWGTEDGVLSENDDTRTDESETIKFLRVTGRVTGVMQVAGAHFESSMQREVINKAQTMNEMIEEEILVGTNAAGNGHNGLQQILTSNYTTDLNAAIALSDVKKLVNDCFVAKGAPNLIITDAYTAEALIEQQMDYVKYVDPEKTIAWGLQTPTIRTVVGSIPVIPSLFMPTTSGERRLFCVNTNYLQQRVLQDITFQRVPSGNDSEKFMLKTYRTFVNKFPEGMGQIAGIDE